MGKTHRNRKYLLQVSMVVLAVVFLVAAVLFLTELWEKKRGQYTGTGSQTAFLEHGGKSYALRSDVETFLVIGLDSDELSTDTIGYANNSVADFLMLVVIDNTAESYSVVQINRDTIAEINRLGVAGQKLDTVSQQIALAYTYGNGREVSCRNTVDAVSTLLKNIRVHHYAAMAMETVPVLNDLVGGVTVTVMDDFSGIDPTLVQGTEVTLQGEQALLYVRARQGMEDSSNLHRMERQRQYVKALYEQVLSQAEASESFIAETIASLNDRLLSDCSVTKLQTLFERIADYEFTGIRELAGESVAGERFMEFYPDDAALSELVIELLCTEEE
ncbi:MAG: hypothetical protein E7452_07555 [Ruminococcaceae bacterium]|nr:hypothetical protein [Oscillospiraceae bacterium]MBQ4048083.1 LCP family protein [Clostridia bacterium]